MADKRSVFWKPDVKPLRIVPGASVAAPKGYELVEAMQTNMREATALLHEAESRVRTYVSTRDIYEDMDAPVGRRVLKASTDEARVALSDVQRARVEVAHWTEYLGWARSQAPASDTRLPMEREPGEDDGDEAGAVA